MAVRKKAAKKKAARKRSPTRRTKPKDRKPLDVTDFCPGCRQYLPLSAWALDADEQQSAATAFVCRKCRKAKKKPKEEFLPQLAPKHRKILRDLIQTQNFASTAKKYDMSVTALKNMLQGRGQDTKLVREAWREILTSEGIDLITLIEIARMQLYAMEPKWNKRTESWDFFPDHKTRQRAVQFFVKQHNMDTPVETSRSQIHDRPTQVVFATSLNKLHDDPKGLENAFVIEGEFRREGEEQYTNGRSSEDDEA